MRNDFKVGDVVKYIGTTTCYHTVGKTYIVDKRDEWDEHFVLDDEGTRNYAVARRPNEFELVEAAPQPSTNAVQLISLFGRMYAKVDIESRKDAIFKALEGLTTYIVEGE